MISVADAKAKTSKFKFSKDLSNRKQTQFNSALAGKTIFSRKVLNHVNNQSTALFIERLLARHNWLAVDQVNGIIGGSTIEAFNKLGRAYDLPELVNEVITQEHLLALMDGTKGNVESKYDSFYQRARAYAKKNNMVWYDDENYVNLITVRGYAISNKNGVIDGYDIKNIDNTFNDAMFWCYRRDGKEFVEAYKCTVDPGFYYYSVHPLNPKGCAHLANGQWHHKLGLHGRARYAALVQAAPVRVYRTFTASFNPDTDFSEVGWFGIHQHAGNGSNWVYNSSAGCIALQSHYKSVAYQTYIKRLRNEFKNHSTGVHFRTIVVDTI